MKHTIISCPHCGHPVHLDLDFCEGDQDYFEDCANCFSPIHLNMHINDLSKKLELAVSADDEQLY
ncbi:MAG: CPXCG motif-containing cysteine-rich protein [Paraglaciecola sp.]|nr:CPXCG motif-containing cysteine-rich protein [Paraglaciecola sp.]MDP5031023.1 CPXCG motif-containing cysteine-rich protein [Paraglaciecola sp.]MDP5131326.1 CPXCG motif-containing cysteine-rich protein [Paraglaciecola sp.]